MSTGGAPFLVTSARAGIAGRHPPTPPARHFRCERGRAVYYRRLECGIGLRCSGVTALRCSRSRRRDSETTAAATDAGRGPYRRTFVAPFCRGLPGSMKAASICASCTSAGCRSPRIPARCRSAETVAPMQAHKLRQDFDHAAEPDAPATSIARVKAARLDNRCEGHCPGLCTRVGRPWKVNLAIGPTPTTSANCCRAESASRPVADRRGAAPVTRSSTAVQSPRVGDAPHSLRLRLF